MADAKATRRISAVSQFGALVNAKTSVVVTVPAAFARNFFADPKSIFQNYETLVGAAIRQPAIEEADRARAAVGGWFFGTAAPQILYGVLSTTTRGLVTYGDIAMRLKPTAIQSRTSFLERNTYHFVEEHKPQLLAAIPPGYRAVWANRDELAIAKHGANIDNGQTESDWEELLLSPDASDRRNDEFIEAHVFESITQHSVEQANQINMTPSKSVKLDIEIALEKFHTPQVST